MVTENVPTSRVVPVTAILKVQLVPGASGVLNEHVVPAKLKRPARLSGKLVAEMSSGAVPVLVTLTTAVLAPAVNISVRTPPKPVTSVPPVAPVKLRVPAA